MSLLLTRVPDDVLAGVLAYINRHDRGQQAIRLTCRRWRALAVRQRLEVHVCPHTRDGLAVAIERLRAHQTAAASVGDGPHALVVTGGLHPRVPHEVPGKAWVLAPRIVRVLVLPVAAGLRELRLACPLTHHVAIGPLRAVLEASSGLRALALALAWPSDRAAVGAWAAALGAAGATNGLERLELDLLRPPTMGPEPSRACLASLWKALSRGPRGTGLRALGLRLASAGAPESNAAEEVSLRRWVTGLLPTLETLEVSGMGGPVVSGLLEALGGTAAPRLSRLVLRAPAMLPACASILGTALPRLVGTAPRLVDLELALPLRPHTAGDPMLQPRWWDGVLAELGGGVRSLALTDQHPWDSGSPGLGHPATILPSVFQTRGMVLGPVSASRDAPSQGGTCGAGRRRRCRTSCSPRRGAGATDWCPSRSRCIWSAPRGRPSGIAARAPGRPRRGRCRAFGASACTWGTPSTRPTTGCRRRWPGTRGTCSAPRREPSRSWRCRGCEWAAAGPRTRRWWTGS